MSYTSYHIFPHIFSPLLTSKGPVYCNIPHPEKVLLLPLHTLASPFFSSYWTNWTNAFSHQSAMVALRIK